jgi:hypothetical protein
MNGARSFYTEFLLEGRIKEGTARTADAYMQSTP